MPRASVVPEGLKHGPFTLQQALAAGLTARQLRSSAWVHLCFNWYCWAGLPVTEEMRLTVIHRGLPKGAAFAGATAARLHGLDIAAPWRPEVIVPPALNITDRVHATMRRVALPGSDLVWRRGFPVTSPLRTAFDLAGRLPLVEGVAAVDMALRSELIDLDAFRSFVQAHETLPGVVRARRVVCHAEPRSESPMESRLRMVLVLGGLPRPEAQVELFTETGVFVGRADLYYRQAALAVEFDGDNHRDRLVSDDRRQNRFQEIGVALLRYTTPDLLERPGGIVGEVSAALRRRTKGRSVRGLPLPRAG